MGLTGGIAVRSCWCVSEPIGPASRSEWSRTCRERRSRNARGKTAGSTGRSAGTCRPHRRSESARGTRSRQASEDPATGASSTALPWCAEIARDVFAPDVRLASHRDDRAAPRWSPLSKGSSPRSSGGGRTIEPALRLRRDGFRRNRRAGRHAHLDHDQSQKGLHGVGADAHPTRNLFAAQALQEML
jgi:hypothetical protein